MANKHTHDSIHSILATTVMFVPMEARNQTKNLMKPANIGQNTQRCYPHPCTIYEHICKAYHCKLLLSLKKKCQKGDPIKLGSDNRGKCQSSGVAKMCALESE